MQETLVKINLETQAYKSHPFDVRSLLDCWAGRTQITAQMCLINKLYS